MALVCRIDACRPRQTIARDQLRTCEELDIRVIAEGVESAGERDFFEHAGVTPMQGYLFARPVFRGLPAVGDAGGH